MPSVRPILSVFLLTFATLLCAQNLQLAPGFNATLTDNRAIGQLVAVLPDGRVLSNHDTTTVRYNVDGSLDPTFRVDPAFTSISLAAGLPDGRIFAQCTTQPGNGSILAVLKSDGSLARTVGSIPGDRLFVQADGKVLVVANNAVITVNGVSRPGLARFNADGSFDATFDPGFGPQLRGSVSTGQGLIWSAAFQSDGKILIGGFFNLFDGVTENQVVRLNTNGTVDPTFAAPSNPIQNGSVNEVAVFPNGKVLVYTSAVTDNLWRLNADGSLDASLGGFSTDAGTRGSVYDMVVRSDGRVVIGGYFSSFNGRPDANLLVMNADGTVEPSFNAGAIVSHGGSVYIQHFARLPDDRLIVDYEPTSLPLTDHLVRLNVDGSLDPSFMPGPALPPAAVIADRLPDGRLTLAGTFTTVNGGARPGLVRLLPDGSIDPAVHPPTDLPVSFTGLATLTDGTIVFSGPFLSIAGQSRSGVARLLADGSLDPNFHPALNAGATVNALLTLPDGRVVIGGSFSTVNGVVHSNLAALLPDGSLDSSFAATANGPIATLVARGGGGFFATGTFTLVGGQRRTNLAALSADGSVDAAFAPTMLTTSDAISALTSLPDGSVVIGTTSGIRGQLRHFNRDGSLDSGYVFPFAVNATFTALASDSAGRVLAAYTATETGALSTATSVHYFLQRFTTTGALDPSFNLGSGASGPITALVPAADGSLIVGGSFATLDDLPAAGVARLVPASSGPTANSPLLNISTRARVGPDASDLIAGFVIGGATAKTVLLRAVGPGLTQFGITNANPDPSLAVYDSAHPGATYLATNEDWGRVNVPRGGTSDVGFAVATDGARVGAFPLQPADAALVITLPPGAYTALVGRGAAGGFQSATAGVALIEVYDLNALPGDRRLLNISSRGFAGAGDATLIAGFVIGGTAPKQVLVRAAGPGLAPFQVANALANPTLAVVNGTGTVVASNDDWGTNTNPALIRDAAVKTGAFAFADGSKDSALLLTLPPGNYTALVNGAGNTSGIALVEVYEVP